MAVSEVGVRRITNTRLIDHDGLVKHGNFLLHEDGSYSESNGDEDVIEEIDGSTRLITRSFQNWHTHLPMILNRGMGEGLPLMEWLEKSIFPVEKFLTPEFVEIGTRAAAAEMIATEIILPSFFSLNIGIGLLIVGICNFFVHKETGFLLEHKYNLLIGSLSMLISFMMLRRYYHNKKHKDINEY